MVKHSGCKRGGISRHAAGPPRKISPRGAAKQPANLLARQSGRAARSARKPQNCITRKTPSSRREHSLVPTLVDQEILDDAAAPTLRRCPDLLFPPPPSAGSFSQFLMERLTAARPPPPHLDLHQRRRSQFLHPDRRPSSQSLN
jgi:hypothetical protein